MICFAAQLKMKDHELQRTKNIFCNNILLTESRFLTTHGGLHFRYFRTNDTFSDQWVFGPMTHFFGPMVFGSMPLFRTNGSSDRWVFGPMGRRTNGFSDQWVVGPMGCRTIDMAPKIMSIMLKSKAQQKRRYI